MGYTTDFYGQWTVHPKLLPNHRTYLQRFAEIRHMKRDGILTNQFPDPIRDAVGLPCGDFGEFYVGGLEEIANTHERAIDILDYNMPPPGQPGLWCQWTPADGGNLIEWDGGEKFYEYVPWIEYLIEAFLKPWGYRVDGDIEWEGEGRGDLGIIEIHNNVVTARPGRVSYT